MSDSVIRLYSPPKPTVLDPYAQIKWIFFQVGAEFDEPYSSTFRYACNKYVDYVIQTGAGYPELELNRRFYLNKFWESGALIRFNDWLLRQDLRSKTRYTIYKTVRRVMDVAYSLRVIDVIVYHAPMFKGVSETKERAAYAKREQEIINAALGKWISLAKSVLIGYSPTGEGITYRRRDFLQPINIDGCIYTMKSAAKVFGVEHGLVTQRIKMGWTARQAVGLDLSPRAKKIKWEINGEVFQNAEAVAKRFGLSASVISYRAKRGWSIEQIVGLAEKPKVIVLGFNKKKISIGGESFESIKCACQHFNLKYRTVNLRLANGWSLEEAFELEGRDLYGEKITVEGINYHSITAASEAYGMSRSLVSARLKKGLTPEQAMGIEPYQVAHNDDRALLWMFENIYGCDAQAMREDFYERRSRLTHTCSQQRLLKLFARWGVWPYIDDRLVLPLAVEMAMLTGLNVEALKVLEIDSLQLEHRLTRQAVINYSKRRSGSATRSEDRELHLPVLELEELYLDDSVVERIVRLWDLVIALTSRIRGRAPSELSRRLFIYEDVELSRKNAQPMIVPIEPAGKTSTWYARFCREEGLYEIFGEKFNFNMARCRPTLATNMVLAGADLFQVQVALGHESIQATATYLDEHELRPKFNKTVSEALESISRRSLDFQKDSTENLSSPIEGEDDAGTGFHETLSGCGCMNPYQPSEHVRALTKLAEGAICKYWNMCLLCDNAVVTENSLPKLIVYRSRVIAALEGGSPAIKARKELYEDVIKLVDGIVEPDVIFPASVIENAVCIGASMDDLLVDQLVYQGV